MFNEMWKGAFFWGQLKRNGEVVAVEPAQKRFKIIKGLRYKNRETSILIKCSFFFTLNKTGITWFKQYAESGFFNLYG